MADIKLHTGTYGVINPTGINAVGVEEVRGFKPATADLALQNGMFVKIDEVKETVALPTAVDNKVWLHYSVEKLYNGEGFNKFVADKDYEFLRRAFRARKGMEFETNTVVFSDAVFADVNAIKTYLATNPIYAIPDTTGYVRLVKTLPTTPAPVTYGEVKEVVTLPNGEVGLAIILTVVAQ